MSKCNKRSEHEKMIHEHFMLGLSNLLEGREVDADRTNILEETRSNIQLAFAALDEEIKRKDNDNKN